MQLNGHECGKTNVMGIARAPSPAQIVTEQKQLEILDYLNYLFSMISNNIRCEILFRIFMT
jgi:hypothetical protein